ADDLLGAAVIVSVGSVDEIDAEGARLGDDALARRRVGAPAEHHRAETDRRHLETAAAEQAIVHPSPPFASYCAVQPPSIETVVPVIVAALSPHRKTARAPRCSGVENCSI